MLTDKLTIELHSKIRRKEENKMSQERMPDIPPGMTEADTFDLMPPEYSEESSNLKLIPAPSVWMITMLVRYNFSPVPHIVTIPAYVRLNGDGLKISDTIRAWTEWDGPLGITGELLDWRLTEYAPIPF